MKSTSVIIYDFTIETSLLVSTRHKIIHYQGDCKENDLAACSFNTVRNAILIDRSCSNRDDHYGN